MNYFLNEKNEYICCDVTSEWYGRNIIIYKHWIRVVSLFFVLFCLLLSTKIDSRGWNDAIIKTIIHPKFTKENLIKEINKLNPTYKDLCIAQCYYETSMGTSELYKKTNNLFCLTVFRLSEEHLTVNLQGVNYYFKVYSDWQESVKDWYRLVSSKQNEALINYMSAYYCKDAGYVDNLKKIFKTQQKNDFNNN